MGLIIQQPRPIGILLSLVHILLCLSKNKIAALWTDIATAQKLNSQTLATPQLWCIQFIYVCLVLSKLECTVHVALPKQPIIDLKPAQQTRQQALKAYCPTIHTVVGYSSFRHPDSEHLSGRNQKYKVTLSELILLEVAELSSHKSIMARHSPLQEVVIDSFLLSFTYGQISKRHRSFQIIYGSNLLTAPPIIAHDGVKPFSKQHFNFQTPRF